MYRTWSRLINHNTIRIGLHTKDIHSINKIDSIHTYKFYREGSNLARCHTNEGIKYIVSNQTGIITQINYDLLCHINKPDWYNHLNNSETWLCHIDTSNLTSRGYYNVDNELFNYK
uniref:Uncharacterized protein n=1 Tax=Megaviridae environmental sample TaxID=1737588 RepID=A0A5J6VJW6_9VIRU|nr:MAG: hypothetical protein [Megaviridae environmental sample]